MSTSLLQVDITNAYVLSELKSKLDLNMGSSNGVTFQRGHSPFEELLGFGEPCLIFGSH